MEGASDGTRHGRRADDRRDARHDARHGRVLPDVPVPGGSPRLAGTHPACGPAVGGPARHGRQGGRALSSTTRHAEVIVVGGGQAGMAAGYYLAQSGIDFLILDASPSAGHAWAQRWDTL